VITNDTQLALFPESDITGTGRPLAWRLMPAPQPQPETGPADELPFDEETQS
jgi:hypothetical protein